MKYKKKPCIIEAKQFNGYDNLNEILDFIGDEGKVGTCINEEGSLDVAVIIRTLEGNMQASKGDYIIKGVHGEFYPCKPDIFNETHDPVEE